MDIEQASIPGCFILQARLLNDARGRFVKTFHIDRFAELGLRTDWREEYFSSSVRNVVRGMHFQTPPADHAKMVFCLTGTVLDVVIDLRRGSPCYGQAFSVELSEQNGRGLYIPTGCAHGFVALGDDAGMYYKVTSVYAAANDAGIAWDSIDFDWPVASPELSERDRCHPRLADFKSPFVFDPAQVTR